MKKTFLILFVVIFSGYSTTAQKFDNLALTPPMGWNSWNRFKCDINEKLVREIAKAMVETGMKDAGYRYIVIDDCWQVARDEEGNILADPDRFPSGIAALADYIHSLGLKFGLYSDAGVKTCQKRPGSRGYEFQDARTYARWGVDYLKYDWCDHSTQNAPASYALMRDALYKAGRPVVFSICEWGQNQPWLWGKDIGHLWRATGDIRSSFIEPLDWGETVVSIIEKVNLIRKYSGPGHWNDLDMLQVGNKGISVTESRSHFTMWCMLSSPLMAGNDLRNMPEEIKNILINKEVIALNQDSLGIPALKWVDYGDFEIWLKPLQNGDYALCFLNLDTKTKNFEIELSGNRVYDGDFNKIHNGIYEIDDSFQIRDLWKHKMIGTTKEKLSIRVPGHDVVLLRLIK